MTTERVYVITKVKKRSGAIQDFDEQKIVNAIYKALEATGQKDSFRIAGELKARVVKNLQQRGYGSEAPPMVEDIQDTVEEILLESGFGETARAYIVYRHERRKVRDEKMKILNVDELGPVARSFPTSSLRVLASRYLLRDGQNQIVETPEQLFTRNAVLVGLADIFYDRRIFELDGSEPVHKEWITEAESYIPKAADFGATFKVGDYSINRYHFDRMINRYISLAKAGQMKVSFKHFLKMLAEGSFNSYANNITAYEKMMVSRDFLPNTPTLMNAGAPLGQLSACFVLGMGDDLESIMKTTSDAARIFKSGGGVGINYSDLRHAGDIVASTSGVASGPTSFMDIINTVTNVIKQGGKRRGANMGILECWHPDVAKFITMKEKPGVMENFNVSVGIWEDFWQAMIKGDKYPLRSARNRDEVTDYIDARNMMDMIAMSAWKSAEPGVIFFDNINKYNPAIPLKGKLRATNPCGEQSLYPYESCNLGSINLANFVKRNNDGLSEFDWPRYEQAIRLSTRFLDNVIDMNKYPIEEIDYESKMTRRIGVGSMGVADALFMLRLPYNSQEGFEMMNKLAEALTFFSMHESVQIAHSRGAFPYFDRTDYVSGKIPVAGYYELPQSMRNYDWDSLIEEIRNLGIRNSWTTTVAPTGTLSMIADCSNGVEPSFALVYEKRVTVGSFYYNSKILESVLRQRGLFNDEILAKIANNYGSIKGIKEIPEDIQKIFVTAMDIHWLDHVVAQAIWQRWISNAIAKTINMPGDVTAEDIKSAYLIAHELGLKGVTVFRDGSRKEQVLHITGDNDGKKKFEVTASEYAIDYLSNNVKEQYVLDHARKLVEERTAWIPQVQQKEQVVQSPPVKEEILVHPVVHDNGVGNDCPTCNSPLINQAGCKACIECGYSLCTSG